VRSSGDQLGEVARLLDDGTLRVVIDSEFTLRDAEVRISMDGRGRWNKSAST
jgi:NADPH:quinone reductase-like Zn-dependent oxidoreductase